MLQVPAGLRCLAARLEQPSMLRKPASYPVLEATE